jgi:ribosomal protein L34E
MLIKRMPKCDYCRSLRGAETTRGQSQTGEQREQQTQMAGYPGYLCSTVIKSVLPQSGFRTIVELVESLALCIHQYETMK